MGNKTFCIMPFIHLQIKPDGQVKPCCRFEFNDPSYTKETGFVFDEFNLDSKDLKDTINSPVWQDIRNKMIAGEYVAGCKRCYQEESIGNHSMRNFMNMFWNNNIQEKPDNDEVKLKYIEMTFGNYCNLKCRTCNSDLSSTWNEDENFLADTGLYSDRKKRIKVINTPNTWKPEQFKNVTEIKFTGGEPMLHPEFLGFLDMLIEINLSKYITLDVFTNCSWIPKSKHFDRFTKFKKNKISLSVDGIGQVNDYIRNPSDWSTVDSAANKWLQIELANSNKFEIIWHPTINIYNALSVDQMIQWWINSHKEDAFNLNGKSIINKTKFNVLVHPNYLSPGLLPVEAKNICKDRIYELINNDSIKQIDFNNRLKVKLEELANRIVNNSVNSRYHKLFLSYTLDLDKLRNEKLADCIPELYQYFILDFKNAQ
jgi:organic radical activating enzyme